MPEGPLCVANTAGAEINEIVRQGSGEPVTTKNFPNWFRDTRLQELLCRTLQLVLPIGN